MQGNTTEMCTQAQKCNNSKSHFSNRRNNQLNQCQLQQTKKLNQLISTTNKFPLSFTSKLIQNDSKPRNSSPLNEKTADVHTSAYHTNWSDSNVETQETEDKTPLMYFEMSDSL